MSTRRLTWLIVALIAILSILDHAGVFGYRGNDRLRYHGETAKVLAAIDVDTYEINIPDGRSPATQVKLWGVLRLPELEDDVVDDRDERRGGRTPLERVRDEVVGHRYRIALEPHRSPRDDQDRLRVYLYDEETGEMLNQSLIARGWAQVDPDSEHILKQEFIAAAGKR